MNRDGESTIDLGKGSVLSLTAVEYCSLLAVVAGRLFRGEVTPTVLSSLERLVELGLVRESREIYGPTEVGALIAGAPAAEQAGVVTIDTRAIRR
ncbi:hypothetical protein [Planctomyces sp. SH-PL14]|uniref:hypothetical protein n=1 Tax=Planctomyces sp. SH-PL14 TaxID=1632864 RepID=UPI0012E8A534|nr:hypothetical protein [Planctomyces sp. SH-PL14]